MGIVNSKRKKVEEVRSQEYDEVKSFDIAHVRDGKYGVSFTLILNGVSINGVRVRETKDGREFLALPQYKGNDGKYYHHVFFRFSDEDTAAILQLVAGALTEGEG